MKYQTRQIDFVLFNQEGLGINRQFLFSVEFMLPNMWLMLQYRTLLVLWSIVLVLVFLLFLVTLKFWCPLFFSPQRDCMDSNSPYNNWSYWVWSAVPGMEYGSAGMDCRSSRHSGV